MVVLLTLVIFPDILLTELLAVFPLFMALGVSLVNTGHNIVLRDKVHSLLLVFSTLHGSQVKFWRLTLKCGPNRRGHAHTCRVGCLILEMTRKTCVATLICARHGHRLGNVSSMVRQLESGHR